MARHDESRLRPCTLHFEFSVRNQTLQSPTIAIYPGTVAAHSLRGHFPTEGTRHAKHRLHGSAARASPQAPPRGRARFRGWTGGLAVRAGPGRGPDAAVQGPEPADRDPGQRSDEPD